MGEHENAKTILLEICHQWEKDAIDDTQNTDPQEARLEGEVDDTDQSAAD